MPMPRNSLATRLELANQRLITAHLFLVLSVLFNVALYLTR